MIGNPVRGKADVAAQGVQQLRRYTLSCWDVLQAKIEWRKSGKQVLYASPVRMRSRDWTPNQGGDNVLPQRVSVPGIGNSDERGIRSLVDHIEDRRYAIRIQTDGSLVQHPEVANRPATGEARQCAELWAMGSYHQHVWVRIAPAKLRSSKRRFRWALAAHSADADATTGKESEEENDWRAPWLLRYQG